ncbi:MAG: endonuclease domain-containing protein [Mucilaginibacter sp.]|nr:endonuclease domain-containing protein [Mucilaginibacter sp.]
MRRKIIPYHPSLKAIAKKLRNDATPGEIMLWQELRNNKLGYDFHRQKPLLNYIVDFYCSELNLVIELDGRYHSTETQATVDTLRDQELATYELTVLRFSENEVRNDMFNVLRTIANHIKEHTPYPSQEGNICGYR